MTIRRLGSFSSVALGLVGIHLAVAARAAQITITITGTVSSGTDGNPNSNPPGGGNIFGVGSDLSGQPFTFSIQISDSNGTPDTPGKCSDGTIYSSAITGSSTSSPPTARLQIGGAGRSFTYGGLSLSSIGWTMIRTARTACFSYNSITLGWSEYEYSTSGDYSGGSGFGTAVFYTQNDLTPGLWSTPVPLQGVTPLPLHFSITVTQGTNIYNDLKFASGELNPLFISVQSQPPVIEDAKTLGNCICSIPPSSASQPLANTSNQLPQGSGILQSVPAGMRGYLLPLGGFLPTGLSNYRPGLVSVADPITLATGNVFEAATDYSTAGQNPLVFTRSYNSMASPAGSLATALGVGWRSNYDRFIKLTPATSPSKVLAERIDGQQLTFTWSGSDWVTDSDTDLTLTQSGTIWTLKDPSDTLENYTVDAAGLGTLASVTARNGYAQTLTWSAGQLQSVTDSYGRSLTFTYSGAVLTSLATPDNTITYGYSSGAGETKDRLTTVSWAMSPPATLAYLYEDASYPYAMTGVTDEDGERYATWSYDSRGRAVTNFRGGGIGADSTKIAYNDGSTVTVTSALGVTETYTFSTLQGVPKLISISRPPTSTTAAASRSFSYDARGYLASQTDWNGNRTTYVNDVHGQPTTIKEAVGTPQSRITTITYLSDYHLPAEIVTPGLTMSFAYDANGDLLKRTLTDTTTTKVPYSTKGATRTWTFTWSNSLLASSKGPRADVSELTTFSYDKSALTKIVNAVGQTTEVKSHTPGGLPTTIVDANGVTTALTYDDRQRLLTSTTSTAAGLIKTSVAYDAAGNVVETTLPDGSAWTNTYDAAHRLDGVSDLFHQGVRYTLDALGDRTASKIANSSAVIQAQHSRTFDALGRVLEDIGGVGQTTKYAYDFNGNAVTITDPLSHVTRRTFDALNRTIQVVDAGNGITKATYDPHDRPLTVFDANGGTTTYVYDGFGDVIEHTSPDTGKTIYRYDLAGNLIQSVDATDATANYTYDAIDRVLTTKYPADPAENVAYTYDQSGHGFGIGRLTSVTDAVGSLSWTYDERGNLLSERRGHGAVALLTSYTYDKASHVSSITYPSGWSTLYSRDVMGRITAIKAKSPTGASQSIVSGVSYQPYGPVTALTYGNGVVEAHKFDLDYRLTNLTDSGKAPLQKLSYGYDEANNVSSIADGVTAANSQIFGYDVLDRLTSAKGVYGSLGYTYSSIGNRLTQTSGGTTTSYVYASHSNQLTSLKAGATTQTVGYTAAGNIDSFSPAFGQVISLTYNLAGRLASTSGSAGKITQYKYDAFGQRLLKVGAATATSLFQYDGGAHLIQEADGQGNARVDYIYLYDRPVATIQPSNNRVYFLHDDLLGTPQMATDSTQSIAWTTTYQPFGQVGTLPTLILQDLRFPGQENDLETALYHNGFRDYIPTLGRYLESDPIGLAGGSNPYLYAGGNPIRRIDWSGLQAETLPETNSNEPQNILSLTELVNELREFGELAHGPNQIGPVPGNYLVDISNLPLWAQQYINFTTDEMIAQNNEGVGPVCTFANPTGRLPFGGQELRSAPSVKMLLLENGQLSLK